jgi:hypothetical protein|nr:MAG TPA: hypothetical protein [Caudoviricetes sp.]
MAKTSPSNFPRTKKSMNKLKNNIGFTILTAYKLFRVCKDEKEEDINKMTKGMDLSEIDQKYETYSDLRDLLDDANNAGELVLKQQYFDTFYVAEIDQSKNKLVGINKYKISVKIEKVE